MSKQILMVFHQSTSSPGLVGQLLQTGGYRLDMRCPAEGDRLPETLEHHEAVVVFGGPMSANDDDTLPFIRAELDWLPLVLTSEKPYLGICLGAQLMARVLGARVFPHAEGRKEIGYFPMRVTPAGLEDFGRSLQVYHWHGEGFEIPSDAVLLAEGDLFPNQAFRYGDNVYGLQFHPEITETMIHIWTERGADQLVIPVAQSRPEQIQNHQRYGGAIATWLDEFLWDWIGESALRESA
ncbi:MAG: glutamine amidotransferase [Synechococcales cyanobacterium T60_A2020_003]|nr:glutamine amidotransferase [Synechococcales cyanobacterium T60_A2020_003]